ncbi:hypothetical protein NECID01_0885 [Nematocida sp. AWRm77]|nr:hypothetical protein NECID01_0885 [Nematocida sp. AWRm77]
MRNIDTKDIVAQTDILSYEDIEEKEALSMASSFLQVSSMLSEDKRLFVETFCNSIQN